MKRIIVTGATGGIGSELSMHLAKVGYDVIPFARNKEKLDLLSKKIATATASKAPNFSLDLSDIESIDKFDFSSLGPVGGLVLMPPQLDPATDPFATPEAWKKYFDASFIGPLHFFSKLIPKLKESGRAKVVLISGISSLQVLGHYATSNVLRCAWVAQAKTLAHYLGKDLIHVNTLSLGGVLTDEYVTELKTEAMSSATSIEKILERETTNVPLKKYAKPIEVAYAVEGLLGNFSDHITGVNIAVDGGFTRAY